MCLYVTVSFTGRIPACSVRVVLYFVMDALDAGIRHHKWHCTRGGRCSGCSVFSFLVALPLRVSCSISLLNNTVISPRSFLPLLCEMKFVTLLPTSTTGEHHVASHGMSYSMDSYYGKDNKQFIASSKHSTTFRYSG